MLREKARSELHMDAACCNEQILETACTANYLPSHKTSG